MAVHESQSNGKLGQLRMNDLLQAATGILLINDAFGFGALRYLRAIIPNRLNRTWEASAQRMKVGVTTRRTP